MARHLLKLNLSSLALLFALCSIRSRLATAAQASNPPAANPHLGMHNIIILFHAKIAPGCAGKCTVIVEPTNSTSSALPVQAAPPPLRAPLRPWNTLTVASEDTEKYQAKISCSNKCQATTGSEFFPLWASPTSRKVPDTNSMQHQLATLTLHTSHRTANQTNVYISSLNREKPGNTKQQEEKLRGIVVVHLPSTRAVCHAQKAKGTSLLKFIFIIVWITGCPVVAWLVSTSILPSKPC
ncbi:hypothetical protein Ndes2437B_g08070 [Nannochloris sp. 'desiccata']